MAFLLVVPSPCHIYLLLLDCCSRVVGFPLFFKEGRGQERHDPSPLLWPLTISFAILSCHTRQRQYPSLVFRTQSPSTHSQDTSHMVSMPQSWGSAGETPVHRALTPELAAPPLPLPGLWEFLTLVNQ